MLLQDAAVAINAFDFLGSGEEPRVGHCVQQLKGLVAAKGIFYNSPNDVLGKHKDRNLNKKSSCED